MPRIVLLLVCVLAPLVRADDLPAEAGRVIDGYAKALADRDAEAMWGLYADRLRARVLQDVDAIREVIAEQTQSMPDPELDLPCPHLDLPWRAAGRLSRDAVRTAFLEREAQTLMGKERDPPEVIELVVGATLCIAHTRFPAGDERTLRIGPDRGTWRILDCDEFASQVSKWRLGRPAAPLFNCRDFAHWDVVAGNVDRIGRPAGGTPFWDIAPNNGLYLDMVGWSSLGMGKLRTKRAFRFEAGKLYRLSLDAAGNRRSSVNEDALVVSVDGLCSRVIRVEDWRQPMTPYDVPFTPDCTVRGKITIEELTDSGNGGLLIDRVRLEDLSDGEELFYDDFDR